MKKAWNVIERIIAWIFVIIAVAMMIFTIVSVSVFDRNDRSLFGYKAFIVQSDSMKATDFSAGDLILSKEVDPATLKPGDVITFISTNTESYGSAVTHKIREVTVNDKGQPCFVTYGTTTDTNDEGLVTYDYVLGKYEKNLPAVGHFFQFLKTTPGYICCIFLPFMILIVIQAFNSIKLFKQYKKEQSQEIEAEKQKVADEKAEVQSMLKELVEMREQMNQSKNDDKTE